MGGDRHRCNFPVIGNWLLGVSTTFGLARRLAAGSSGDTAIAFALEPFRQLGAVRREW